MKTQSQVDRFCIVAGVLAVILTIGIYVGCLLFAVPAEKENLPEHLSIDYVERIFDDSYVHEIDIRLPQTNWDYMVRFAKEEQYVLCDLSIDGELVENVAIRPKGNSSLSAIQSQGDDHFSFKIEFDHYNQRNTWHGLDKIALNNLGQDASCMKDYLVYHMMDFAGVPAPLSSYVHLKLNGEDFGLYLAVEAIEESFAYRNYGSNYGNIYKPECFAMENLSALFSQNPYEGIQEVDYSQLGPGDRVDLLGTYVRPPFEIAFGKSMDAAAMKYLGDDPELYRVFYDSAVFDLTKEDEISLVRAFRNLSENPEAAVDYESLIPYFVVHNFVDNYDGYTGIFVHNYYLREADGVLSMIPWDYNLAFGVFTLETTGNSILGSDSGYKITESFENAMDDKTNMVNYPIDTPTFTVETKDRPLLAAVLQSDEALERYHDVFQVFLDDFFASGHFEKLYTRAKNIIAPYIAKGQTFYAFDQFVAASEAVHEFCLLRAESVQRQLDGRLPATLEGQSTNYENLVDASQLNLAASVTYDGVLMGITSDDVTKILDAIAGDHPHSMEGVAEAVKEMAENPRSIPAVVGRIIGSSDFLQKGIISAIAGPILFVVAIVTLVLVRKRTMRYKRRKG